MRHPRKFGSFIVALCLTVFSAKAQAQTFNFGTMNGTGDLGNSEVFTLSGWGSVTATASAGYDLWARNGGSGETGLGICKSSQVSHGNCNESGNSDTELGNDPGSITFVLNLLSGITPVSFELASVQNDDDYAYKQGASCGSLGSTINGSGPNDGNGTTAGAQSGGNDSHPYVYKSVGSNIGCLQFLPVPGSQQWDWSSWSWQTAYNQGDYLIYSLTVDGSVVGQELPSASAPEPASMTLLATGLAGLAGMGRRRKKGSAPKA